MSENYQSDLILDVGLANEIKMAARRVGATKADLKRLATGENFGGILPILLGFATAVPLVKFKSWNTVAINQGSTYAGKQYLARLDVHGVKVTQFAHSHLLLNKFPEVEKNCCYEVFLQTAEELGFQSPVTRYEIIQRLKILHFMPCPEEVPLRCLIQETMQARKFTDWPGGSVHVAMVPWVDALKSHSSLTVTKYLKNPELGVLYGDGDQKYPIDSRWMFVRKKGIL